MRKFCQIKSNQSILTNFNNLKIKIGSFRKLGRDGPRFGACASTSKKI
jgi:hypothetical protein